MKSTQGMFDLIQELREETNHHFDRIEGFDIIYIKHLYQTSTKRVEFKEKAKHYLKW